MRTGGLVAVVLVTATLVFTGLSKQRSISRDTALLISRSKAQMKRKHVLGAPRARPVDDDLTKLLESIAVDNMVVASAADDHFREMTWNWICHMRKQHPKFIIFAFDDTMHKFLSESNVTTYLMRPDSKFYTKNQQDKSWYSQPLRWNTPIYNQIVHTKTRLQHAILARGFDLLFCDVDIPWATDISVPMAAHTDLDWVAQHNWPLNDVNVGLFLARSNPRTIKFFELTMAMEKLLAKTVLHGFYPTDDQGIMNFFLVCGHANGTHPGKHSHQTWMSTILERHDVPMDKLRLADHTRVFHADCKESGLDLDYGLLSPKYYQTGTRQMDDKVPEVRKLIFENVSVIYHANYMSSSQKKIAALREAKRWMSRPVTYHPNPTFACDALTHKS